jgi:hypothetical protein
MFKRLLAIIVIAAALGFAAKTFLMFTALAPFP